MEKKSERVSRSVAMTALFVAALVVRLAYLFQFKSSPLFDPQVMGLDAQVFDFAAVRIASGDWIGSGVFEMLPGFAYVLGAFYAFAGRHILAAYVFQACLGSAMVPFVYLIAHRLAGHRAALVAGIGGVISQTLVFHVGMLTGDTCAVLIAAACAYAFLHAVEEERLWSFALAGALAGLGILFRGTFAIFIVMFVPWHIIANRRLGMGKTLVHCAVAIVAAIIVVAPVTIRNYVVAHDFVPVAAHDGLNIYIGYNPYARGGFNPIPQIGIKQQQMLSNAKQLAEKEIGRELKPSEVSRFWKERAIKFVRTNPRAALVLVKLKAFLFFNHASGVADIMSPDAMKSFSWLLKLLLPFGIVSCAGLAGIAVWFLGKDRRKGGGLLCLFIAAGLVAVIITFVNDRYRLISVPFFLIFGGILIDYTIESLRKPRRFVGIALIVAACAAFVYMPVIAKESPAQTAKIIGDYYSQAGNDTEAEKAYLNSIESDKSFVPAYYYLGALYWRQGRYDEAEKMMEEILKRHPTNVPALNSMGDLLIRKGDTDGALRYWKKSLEIKPDQPIVRESIEQHNPRSK